jgi:hypothetical protein
MIPFACLNIFASTVSGHLLYLRCKRTLIDRLQIKVADLI